MAPRVEGGGKGNSGSFVILSGPWCTCGVSPVPEARKGTVLHSIPRSGWVCEGESPLRSREQAAPFLRDPPLGRAASSGGFLMALWATTATGTVTFPGEACGQAWACAGALRAAFMQSTLQTLM